MSLDKSIKELTNRLDEVHPYSAFTTISNHQNRNDGIKYWKGRKIISTKDWNELYKKSSTYTNSYTTTLTSRRPLQYFPDDYNCSISVSGIVEDEKLKEEIQNWNKDYFELLEYRKNPILGRMKCSKCLLSGSNDDPIFVGIEKVFARIVSSQCNNTVNNHTNGIITYHCNIMNIFSCPFESTQESIYPYKRENLFALHQISFAIEQAITTFFEITKQNEIIYEVDFVNDRVHEIHTNYNGEPESWGWNDNVIGLSKVKPISNIVIRVENDIYNILTNREKFELLLQEYENNQLHKDQQQVCCDENTPYVQTIDNSNNKKVVVSTEGKKQQQLQDGQDCSHKGENCHSKNIGERSNKSEEESDNEKLILKLKSKLKEEFKKHQEEQLILLKENKENIIDFIIDNKDSIRVEDLKIYEPVYKCYREKGNCHICNSLSNIICNNCSNYNNEFWLCTNHWQQHAIENH